DAEQDLVELLHTLEMVGARPPTSRGPTPGTGNTMPAALVAAEDILLRQLPLAGTPAERDKLLRVAAADYETVRLTVRDPEREVAAHLEVVDFVLRLSRAEQGVLSPPMAAGEKPGSRSFTDVPFLNPPDTANLWELRLDLHRVLTEMPELQDRRLLPDLFDRVGTSPFAHALWQAPGTQGLSTSPHVLLCDVGGTGTAQVTDFVTDV